MNERIFELIQQQNGNCGLVWSEEDKEKFAELIVRECADIGERYADGNYEVPRQILARFGMDEDEE